MSLSFAPGRHRFVMAVLSLGLIVGSASVSMPGSAAPERTHRGAQGEGDDGTLKGQYDEILGIEARAVRKVQKAQSERLRLTGELDALQLQLKAKQIELFGAQVELDKAAFLAKIYAQALIDAKVKVKVATERLRKQIVAAYVNGGQDAGMLEAVLNARNGQEAGQAMAYSNAVVGDSDLLVRQLETAREEVRRTDKTARSSKAKAAARRDQVKEATAFIEGAAIQKQTLVDQMTLQVMAEAQALREVQGRKALIEGRINAMSRSSDGIAMILANFEKGQPNWIPGEILITTPLPGRFIGSAFGLRFHPILNISRLHAGGDIGAPSGTPIHAAADGIVVIAGAHGGYGNTTVIDHGSSLGTLYGHQSAISVRVGQIVQRGDVIGYVGSTGLSTGPHLHFETRVKGMPIDPEGVVDFSAKVDYGG